MSNLTVFTFVFRNESYDVRFVGTPEKPEWIAQDVCSVLGLSNVSQALKNLKDSYKGVCISDTPSGKQQMLTVNESGLYKLIMKSRKTCADFFQDWLYEEVLPAIRKTGQYAISHKTPAEILHEQTGLLVEHERQLKAVVEQQKAQETKNDSYEERLEAHDAELTRFNNTHGRYYSICGYAAMLRIPLPLTTAAKMGKSATAMCHSLGLPLGEVPDPRFGRVNTYPASVLQTLLW